MFPSILLTGMLLAVEGCGQPLRVDWFEWLGWRRRVSSSKHTCSCTFSLINVKFVIMCARYVDCSWSDGSPLEYQNWADGQPNDKDGTEMCVGMGNGDCELLKIFEKNFTSLPGFEPGISWSVVRRLIHWATRPLEMVSRHFMFRHVR